MFCLRCGAKNEDAVCFYLEHGSRLPALLTTPPGHVLPTRRLARSRWFLLWPPTSLIDTLAIAIIILLSLRACGGKRPGPGGGAEWGASRPFAK